MRSLYQFILLVLLGLSACTDSKDFENPKKVLSSYISKSFSIQNVEQRTDLEAFLVGDAKTRLASWSDEQFEHAFIDVKRKFVKLVIKEVKKISDQETSITYELSYFDRSRSQTGHDAKVTNKKLCHLVKRNGKWLIRDVKNIKELVEYRNEMALP